MPTGASVKIALAQTNPLVGDVAGNTEKIIAYIARAREAGADLVVFPELSIIGYPPRDLLLKADLVQANARALERIIATTERIAAIVGYVQPGEPATGRGLFNAAAVCANRAIASVHRKSLLPTYDVFDESRYFDPDPRVHVTTLALGGRDLRLGVSICEDLWNDEQFVRDGAESFGAAGRRLYGRNPIEEVAALGADLLINVSASPYSMNKQAQRLALFGRQIARHHLPLAYVNQVGGNDHLIFDGASVFFDSEGRVAAQAKAFAEDLLMVEWPHTTKSAPVGGATLKSEIGNRKSEIGRIEPYPPGIVELHGALVLGTRDYAAKCSFADVVLGVSGGIDSAVTAAIACTALGAGHVHGVAMPSRYSSAHCLRDARELAANLGMDYRTIPIDPAHRAMEALLADAFAGRQPDAAEENVQARLRGNVLMALSNKFGWLLLTTGNKSELAVGYCTLYGDMCGGLAVISDVPKTLVYKLADHINAQAGRNVIPLSSITKPPSAELKPNQTDQDTLPPYDLLDAILQRYVEQDQPAEAIVAAGFDAAVVRDVVRRVDRNEYKRQQAALGLRVTSRAFGVGRRVPIAARLSG